MSANLLIALNRKNAELQDSLTVAWARNAELEDQLAQSEAHRQAEHSAEAFQRIEARVTKLEGEKEQIKVLAAKAVRSGETRVAELEKAARAACFEPVGKRRTTCNSEALQALDALLPDQGGEGGS